LRRLGEPPDAKTGAELVGVVVDVPTDAGWDTLYAWGDGIPRLDEPSIARIRAYSL